MRRKGVKNFLIMEVYCYVILESEVNDCGNVYCGFGVGISWC